MESEGKFKILLYINRNIETTVGISENGMKTIQKDHTEVITVYQCKDGTEKTRDSEPTVTINRRAIEKRALLEEKVVETSTERSETFVVDPNAVTKHGFIIETKREAMKDAPTGSSVSGEPNETIKVEISEAILEIGGDCIPLEKGENISQDGLSDNDNPTPLSSKIVVPKQLQFSHKAMPDDDTKISNEPEPITPDSAEFPSAFGRLGVGDASSDNGHNTEALQVEQTKVVIDKNRE